jgi:hypothetical protein
MFRSFRDKLSERLRDMSFPLCLYLMHVMRRGRSQWPRGLRRGSAAARLLGLWVRIPRRHECLTLLSVVFCQVEVSAPGWSLVQRRRTECSVSEFDREASIMRGSWPTMGCCAMGKKFLQRKNEILINKVPYIKVVVGLMLLNLEHRVCTVVFALIFYRCFIQNIILFLLAIFD